MKKQIYLNKRIFKLALSGYLCTLILILIMDWYLIIIHQITQRELYEKKLSDITEEIESDLIKTKEIIYNIYTNNNDFNNLELSNKETEEFDIVYELKNYIENIMWFNNNLHGIYLTYGKGLKSIYRVNTNEISSTHASQINNVLMNSININGFGNINITLENDFYTMISYNNLNTSITAIYSYSNKLENLKNSILNTNVILVDEDNIIGNKNYNYLLNQYKNNFSIVEDGKYIYGSKINNTSLWILLINEIEVTDIIAIPQIIILLIALLSFASILFLYKYLNKELVYPLKYLVTIMNELRNNKDMKMPHAYFKFYELQKVNETLSIMVSELELERANKIKEIEIRQYMEMEYLKLQIKPHFYLNGLKTVNALVLENENERASNFLINMSSHMRYLLNTDTYLVSLYDELDFVNKYISLQQLMIGRKMKLKINCPEDMENSKVPILSIQTFVENSVKHAKLGSSNKELLINVSIEILKTENLEYVDIIISDNGEGYPEDMLFTINENVKSGNCIGIQNIINRCTLIYKKNKCEFNFYNYNGANSEIIIPKEIL